MINNIEIKKIVSVVLIALLVIFTTKVYAATDSFSTTLEASSSKLKRGDNLTITIGLTDFAIESGEKGIGAYTASVKFDSDVLEYVSTNSSDKWEKPFYQKGLITGNTSDGEVVKTPQSIGTITFKVKEDAKLGECTIELNDFSGATGEGYVSAPNKSVTVTIEDNNSGSSTDDDNTNKDDNNNSGNSGNEDNNNNSGNNSSNNNNAGDNNNSSNNNDTNTNNNSSNNQSKSDTSNTNDNSTKKGVLPKAGKTNVIIFVIGTITLVAIVFYIKMKSLSEIIK